MIWGLFRFPVHNAQNCRAGFSPPIGDFERRLTALPTEFGVGFGGKMFHLFDEGHKTMLRHGIPVLSVSCSCL